MKTYTAEATEFNGGKVEYTGLTKGQALWRYNWFNRNHSKLNLKSFGWRLET